MNEMGSHRDFAHKNIIVTFNCLSWNHLFSFRSYSMSQHICLPHRLDSSLNIVGHEIEVTQMLAKIRLVLDLTLFHLVEVGFTTSGFVGSRIRTCR